MLKNISVKNLGCFDEKGCTVHFSEETLIAGPNNSGKSMLLTAMNFVRHYIITRTLYFDSEYFNLRDFRAAVNGHDVNKKIEISFTLREEDADYVFDFRCGRDKDAQMNITQGQYRYPLAAPPILDLLQKIWCLRPNRSPVPYSAEVQQTADQLQSLRPTGFNIINFLLEKWTDRDENWNLAESWLKKIDPDMSQLKTPIREGRAFLETAFGKTDVNLSLQGSGFQNAASIISAVVFSPEGSTLIIEEPEAYLHPRSQEMIADIINDAVNNHGKQIIFSTHSCNILLPFYNDIGLEVRSPRSKEEHVIADKNKFSMWTFEKNLNKVSVKPYPLHEKTFMQFRDDFKYIWG